ncbi:MAG TPA: hypothetical protein VET90_03070, partial [Candidatus Binatus sp.]|nr:hypothetical protein [Candidatus Binatus sp.]
MPEPRRQRGSRIRVPGWAGIAGAAILAAVALGACNPSGVVAPTPAPTQPPALEAPTSSVISLTGACLGPATAGILGRLQARGVDIPGILAINGAALISGLQAFQPQDASTATWRDHLVGALQAGDMIKAASEL